MTDFSDRILDWYDANARELPWRVGPSDRKRGIKPDPYRVWLSEIMLQQTTIPHGIRYFERFTWLWPDIQALAQANKDEIMKEWAGLGYYARARNLHACAQKIAESGRFPESSKALIALPGIGPYTSAAIAAIAYDEAVAVVDGNVERVFSRFLALKQPLKQEKPAIREAVHARLPDNRPGDFAQALMDLGATICTPRSPKCASCPLMSECEAFAIGTPEAFPVKGPKLKQPLRKGVVYIVHDEKKIVLEKRQENGLLGGMLGLPTSDWTEADRNVRRDMSNTLRLGNVEHTFTHFKLDLDVYEERRDNLPDGIHIDIERLESVGLPSVFAKAVRLWVVQRTG